MIRLTGRGRHVFMSEQGPVGLAWTSPGICWLELGVGDREVASQALASRYEDLPEIERAPQEIATIRRRLQAVLRGTPDELTDIPVDLGAVSPFARDVLRCLRRTPWGVTTTYGELAKRAGRPNAARAVGRIMGANPVPIIVPCHRCLGSDGTLTGFSASGGLTLKARLLHHEGWAQRPEHTAGLTHISRVDPVLRRVIRRAGPYLALPDRPQPPWDTLVTAIVHQQLSVKAGRTIAGRVRALTPDSAYPTPAEMLAFEPTRLRACGLSNAKVGFVRDLAARVQDGRLNLAALRRLDDDAVIAALTEVKGIGVWSAHMHLIFHLGRLDVLPVGDLGVRAAAARLYGLDGYATPSELTEIAGKWRPYRSIGSWYLWRALDAGGL